MDWNGDGYPDLIVGDRYGTVNYFRRLASGELTEELDIKANGTTIDVGNNSAPVIVDWNEDGLLDLILGCESGAIRLYLNSGTASNPVLTTYSSINNGGSPISHYRCCPQVYDLNGDGKKDLLCGENVGRIYYYENIGTNESPVFDGYEFIYSDGSIIDNSSGMRLWVNDWNEDGMPDLLTSDYNGWVYVYIAYPVGIGGETGGAPHDASSIFLCGNPTNGLFSLEVNLTAMSNVEIEVFSLDGRLVESVFDGTLNTGQHSFNCNISDNPSGLYLIHCITDEDVLVERVVLTR